MPGTSARVQVVVRVRPFTPNEAVSSGASVFQFIDSKTCTLSAQRFSFDRVFGPRDDQETVFDEQFKESVDHVLDGFNSSLIAYGQTAAGKSFTMTGASEDKRWGIIPRSIARIFANTTQPVRATFVELYNDKVQDLFHNREAVMMLGDGSLRNARVVQTASRAQLLSVIAQANGVRAVASTNMNSQSSRSHAILQLQLGSQHNDAKLVLVDLAGSEKAGKTGNTGAKLGEAGNINKSLTVLAMVIQALSSRLPHVPYRDSKLTQMLRDSIGGNSKTILIVNCSPSAHHERETLSSLRFGTRAKMVENKIQSSNELDTLNKVHYWQQRLQSELQLWDLYGNVPDETAVNLSSIAAIDGFVAPEVDDPYEALLLEADDTHPADNGSVSFLQRRIRELEDQVAEINRKAAEVENSFSIRRTSETEKAAQLLKLQYEQITKALYACREENVAILGDLAAAKALTSQQRGEKYLSTINKACDSYAQKLMSGARGMSQVISRAKRPKSAELSMLLKFRRTGSSSPQKERLQIS